MTVDHLKFQPTPIIRDMRQTARELGIVDLLLDLQQEKMPTEHATDLLCEALERLGVSGDEILTHYNARFRERMPK